MDTQFLTADDQESIAALRRAIDIVGSQIEFAKAINRSPQVINNWLRRGGAPVELCPKIERLVDGKIQCEQLRPNVDWADRKYMPKAA